MTLEDMSRLVQSIREQDTMRTDYPPIESGFICNVFTEYLKRMKYPNHFAIFDSFNPIQGGVDRFVARV